MVRWDGRAEAYRLNMEEGFRTILKELMQHFLDLLGDPDAPVLHRVFPPAYSDPADVERQDEYRRLMMEDLVERRRAECQMVLDLAGEKTLSEEQLLAWSRSINGLRLVLGTFLDVSEDDEPRPPQTPEESAYHFLSYLLEEAVEAMSERAGS